MSSTPKSPMPPRKDTRVYDTGERLTVGTGPPQQQWVTPTGITFSTRSSTAKRKRDQAIPTGNPTPSATPAAKGARTSTTAVSESASVIDLTASTPSPQSTPKKRKQTSGDSPAVQKEEKRLRAFRKKAPQSYLLKLDRARSQRLFVLNRQRSGTEEVPEEIVDIVGSTGNVYQVVVGKVPSCTCPDNLKGNQCKHIVYVLCNVLKAASHLQYQLAFLTSELREIFRDAPISPTDNASTKYSEGKRRKISGDCPICFMEFEPASEEIVWCKAACGNNIHKICFQQWVTSQRGKKVCCVYCRTPWENDKPSNEDLLKQGYVNEEGYLNVGDTMGLPEARDYSTYHQPWARRRYSRYF